MKLPDVTLEVLQEAMNNFDQDLRNSSYWLRWQEDETYKYAIELNGLLYPVKQIVSMATKIPVNQFTGGDQANGYVERRGFKVVELPRASNETWIFQANPDIYDVRAAVRKLPELTWRTTRYRDRIIPGDRVYLWESGPRGGIVAVGEVLSQLSAGPMPVEEMPFVKQSEKLEPDVTRVLLRIVDVVEPILARPEIASHPELTNLQIFKQPQATNFPVERREAQVLEGLLRSRIQPARSRLDLRSAEVLRRLHLEFQKDQGGFADWWKRLTTFLDFVAKANESDRATLEFQQTIWEKNPVSAVGQGLISLDKAIQDEQFRKWLAAKSLMRLPDDSSEAVKSLSELCEEIVERLKPCCRQIPYLKIFRVLTAFFPQHFTTIADRVKLKDLHVAMLGETGAPWPSDASTSGSHAIRRHANILARLVEVLGPAPTDLAGLARRISFPWYLYEISQEQPAADGNTALPIDSLQQLAEDLLIDPNYLTEVTRLLHKKRQLIFYGPPGTGKTFIALQLAQYLTGSNDRIEKVQFHPSYAYEDFVEGYRPSTSSAGQAVFTLMDGPLKRIAEKARNNPTETHVLAIDEVNRGNLAKVFGELYFLLEYRNDGISLLYSRQAFTLPKNLLIIATMNTADRSIALLDAALRRRFYFVPFFPDETPIAGLLRRWLQKNKPDLEWIANVIDLANRQLGDRHIAIGPSYFMDADLDEEWIRLIWNHSIIPYLTEHFFGQEDRLGEFQLDNLRQATEIV